MNDVGPGVESSKRSAAEQFTGMWLLAPTPFTDTGELDRDSITSLVEYTINAGVTGITVLGVAGEAAKLTDRERAIVVEETIDRIKGRIPVCVGINAGSTHASTAHAIEAAKAGAHSLLLAPTPGSRPTDAGLLRHYQSVADATDIPIVIQDHPNFSGVRMSVDVLKKITASSPKLKVIKLEATPTPPKIAQLANSIPDISILGGLGGIMLLEELRNGASGIMTGYGHPEILVDIINRYRSGDVDGATEVFYRYCPAIRFEHQEPIGLAIRKLVYQRFGAIRSAHVRTPGPEIDQSTVDDMSDLFTRLGLHPK